MQPVQIGAEANVDVSIENGNIVLELKYDGKGADASLKVVVESGYFLDKLKEKIPGQLDDSIIELIKGLLAKA